MDLSRKRNWTVKLALLGRFGALRHPHLRSQILCGTLYSVTKIVELVVIKMHLSREFGSNA